VLCLHLGDLVPLATPLAFREGGAERQLVIVDKPLQAARRADAGRAVPHHPGMPVFLLRHVEQALAPLALQVVIRAQGGVHGQRLRDARRRLHGVGVMEHQPVAGQRPRPYAFGPKAGRQRPEPRLPHHVQNIPQAGGLHDPAIHHLMHLAVAQEHRPPGGRNGQPILPEGAAIMADHGDIVAPLIASAGDDLVAAFQIGKGAQQRLPHLRGDGRAPPHLVQRVRAPPFGIGRIQSSKRFTDSANAAFREIGEPLCQRALVRQMHGIHDCLRLNRLFFPTKRQFSGDCKPMQKILASVFNGC